MDMLARVQPADGLEAARQLVAREDWFPTVSRFLDHAQAVARARAIAETPALPRGGERYTRCPPELMARMRDCLKGVSA